MTVINLMIEAVNLGPSQCTSIASQPKCSLFDDMASYKTNQIKQKDWKPLFWCNHSMELSALIAPENVT